MKSPSLTALILALIVPAQMVLACLLMPAARWIVSHLPTIATNQLFIVLGTVLGGFWAVYALRTRHYYPALSMQWLPVELCGFVPAMLVSDLLSRLPLKVVMAVPELTINFNGHRLIGSNGLSPEQHMLGLGMIGGTVLTALTVVAIMWVTNLLFFPKKK